MIRTARRPKGRIHGATIPTGRYSPAGDNPGKRGWQGDNEINLKLETSLHHDGKEIVSTYATIANIDETKVRFDREAECAHEIGIIEKWLMDELIEFYEARNSIHIHAEIRKGLNYQIELSRRVYLRLSPFKDQITQWQRENK